ncbi:hypothetical protein C8Q80DRAFT_1197029 [Daedaleopsis nitida]|nr:hypothetical protein C8Q80DRAFT_1197029 [Daedaleopsis nitida]
MMTCLHDLFIGSLDGRATVISHESRCCHVIRCIAEATVLETFCRRQGPSKTCVDATAACSAVCSLHSFRTHDADGV